MDKFLQTFICVRSKLMKKFPLILFFICKCFTSLSFEQWLQLLGFLKWPFPSFYILSGIMYLLLSSTIIFCCPVAVNLSIFWDIFRAVGLNVIHYDQSKFYRLNKKKIIFWIFFLRPSSKWLETIKDKQGSGSQYYRD